MHTDQVLNQLKKHGQLLDAEIASATGITLAQVRKSLNELSSRGEISQCSVTRFNGNKRIDGFQCRISGYVPPAAPGRKAASGNKGPANTAD
ncbi:MAG: transcriptional regulator [Hydrogenophilales bacterium CG03_land_8_20_14_0_80_62_28]|nr:ArsR family transcriptional regulator [Betaproteobacteria bacterium]OIO78937.1 MAG: transcriptional regulator [Hydrogenophilaceae bacterium CG1_02_62_390]PIV24076.1 MAG: transcriptional regulator [Hydrogenophilales bacterium CG03_land_8_20_14_0_80_62_28]PIW37539.1 MAG: transcriptional regulator [Hydrogenophilales bacterium CG15_BIG_FIL_POST_REV_8_21_14_020_62_31]PIW70990.1 MAG: transcriptional regulator [Hydrogenophilales bacterium CG12_big_fil_rev_8_21_14_0_65_61_21]PIX00788.1 MAG: transcr